ncbi:hypothetical protein SNEBB_000486 [Seison nebaliae]|nr:hypothetical protein SNEBB_000486 [Seison nebaliae]
MIFQELLEISQNNAKTAKKPPLDKPSPSRFNGNKIGPVSSLGRLPVPLKLKESNGFPSTNSGIKEKKPKLIQNNSLQQQNNEKNKYSKISSLSSNCNLSKNRNNNVNNMNGGNMSNKLTRTIPKRQLEQNKNVGNNTSHLINNRQLMLEKQQEQQQKMNLMKKNIRVNGERRPSIDKMKMIKSATSNSLYRPNSTQLMLTGKEMKNERRTCSNNNQILQKNSISNKSRQNESTMNIMNRSNIVKSCVTSSSSGSSSLNFQSLMAVAENNKFGPKSSINEGMRKNNVGELSQIRKRKSDEISQGKQQTNVGTKQMKQKNGQPMKKKDEEKLIKNQIVQQRMIRKQQEAERTKKLQEAQMQVLNSKLKKPTNIPNKKQQIFSTQNNRNVKSISSGKSIKLQLQKQQQQNNSNRQKMRGQLGEHPKRSSYPMPNHQHERRNYLNQNSDDDDDDDDGSDDDAGSLKDFIIDFDPDDYRDSDQADDDDPYMESSYDQIRFEEQKTLVHAVREDQEEELKAQREMQKNSRRR